MEPSSMSFGLWLRRRRQALGLTHAALAEHAHCSVSALRKLESDERRPSQRLAERLASCLQIPAAERERLISIARGDRRLDRLGELSPPVLPSTAALVDDAAAADAPPSIAVLPFANLSDDARNEHFADGLAEELLNVLAKIPGLRVASRTSAFSFKGQTVDVPTIARRLNVATVLEGSVRKSGSRVRITAQLVHAPSDSHLWSHTYDRELDDIFVVQDDIARSVVGQLRATLLGEQADAAAEARVQAQVSAASRGRTADSRAHELYLLGRFLVDRMNADDSATGIAYLRQALQIDPRYARAWAGLAGAYSNQADYAWAPMAETFDLARAAARHALELEPDLAEAHVELAWIQMCHEWDWRGASASSARALELGASDRSALITASVLADSLGRKDQALAYARRAALHDPLSYIAHGNLALRCLNAGLFDEADAALREALRLSPRAGLLPTVLGTLRLEQQRPQEALEAFQQEEIEALRLSGVVMGQFALGHTAESDAALEQLIKRCSEHGALQVAEALAYRGDVDRAFEWLERAYQQRDSGLPQMRSWPLLRNLHEDPRWQPFLKKIGFVESKSAP